MSDKNNTPKTYEQCVAETKAALEKLSHDNAMNLAAEAMVAISNIRVIVNQKSLSTVQRIQIIKKMVNGKQNETN